jgi:PPOX class probable F420-dependent enzyme
MPTPIPPELRGQKYISLVTFRKTGVPVRTPIWFAEGDHKLYVFSNPKAGKVKRIRNNQDVRIAPCTMTGRVTGPEFTARARILPPEQWPAARKRMEEKYWLMRVPFLWSRESVFVELEMV